MPWSPKAIARAVEAHHWPPPTYWIRDMLEGIASAWEADRIDAARYRWLRDGNAYAPEEDGVRGDDDLDKLCDAALAEEKP